MRSYTQTVVTRVEAIQWTGENLAALVDAGFPLPATVREGYILELAYGHFDKQTVRPGDYLVRVGSRFTVVPQGIFDATYVPDQLAVTA